MIDDDDDPRILIDSMALADGAFLRCRYPTEKAEPVLAMLLRTLPLVEERGTVLVEVPSSWARDLPADGVEGIKAAAEADRAAPVKNRHLLPAIEVGARELQRLWAAHDQGPIRSLGYALHALPQLVQTGQPFDPVDFRFNFRIAAFHWAELSAEARRMLCALVGIDPSVADQRARKEGFAIDMYRAGPGKKG